MFHASCLGHQKETRERWQEENSASSSSEREAEKGREGKDRQSIVREKTKTFWNR